MLDTLRHPRVVRAIQEQAGVLNYVSPSFTSEAQATLARKIAEVAPGDLPGQEQATGDRVIDLSAKTAQLLGFHGHGLAKVKVDYIGRAPLEGSDDRKLMATLRDGVPGSGPAQAAAAKLHGAGPLDLLVRFLGREDGGEQQP